MKQWILLALAVFLGVMIGSAARSFGAGLAMVIILGAPLAGSLWLQRIATKPSIVAIDPRHQASVQREVTARLGKRWSYQGTTNTTRLGGAGDRQVAHVWQHKTLLNDLVSTDGTKLAVVIAEPSPGNTVLACWASEWTIHKGGVVVPGLLAAVRRKREIEDWARSLSPGSLPSGFPSGTPQSPEVAGAVQVRTPTTGDHAHSPTAHPPRQRVTLRNPGGTSGDPRQTMYELVAGGATVACYGKVPVERTLGQLAELIPSLTRSRRLGAGLFLKSDPAIALWAAIDGPKGSAVAFWMSDPSANDSFFESFVRPTEDLPPPLQRDLAFNGQLDPGLADILTTGDVVPVWEVAAFRNLDDGSGYPALPASIRRAARAWQRANRESFHAVVESSDGERASVFLCLDSALGVGTTGTAVLSCTLCDSPHDHTLDGFKDVVRKGPYSVHHMKDAVVLTQPVPPGISTMALDSAAASMVNDVAAFNRSVHAMRNSPLAGKDASPA